MDKKGQNAAKNGGWCGRGGARATTISFCALSLTVTCFFVYRVIVLESRVDYLENEFDRLSKLEERLSRLQERVIVSQVSSLGEESDVTLSRLKRNAAECVCPPGKKIS